MARQPSAQNAYAPCASASGWADIPPSKVWPVVWGGWLGTAVQGPGQGLWRDLGGTVHTFLYVVGKFRKQRGVIGRPSRGFGGEVQRKVQKGNNDRCTIGPSVSDL